MSAVSVTKHGRTRFWAVRDVGGDLICVCVYKRGAIEVARRLTLDSTSNAYYLRENPPEISREPVRALSKTAE
jgi:hypothetical protein